MDDRNKHGLDIGLLHWLCASFFVFTFSANAERFGYKSGDGDYGLIIEANIERLPNISLVQDSLLVYTGDKYSPLVKFLECNLRQKTTCFNPNSKYYNPDNNSVPYIKYLESVRLNAVMKWGSKLTFVIKYKAKERSYAYKDFISFDCVTSQECYPVNTFSEKWFENKSLDIDTILSAIYSSYLKKTVKITHPIDNKKYSQFHLLGKDSGIKVWVNWQSLKPNDISNKVVNSLINVLKSCTDNNCKKENVSSAFGDKAEQISYSLAIYSSKKGTASGFVDLNHFQSLLSQWQECSLKYSVLINSIQFVAGKCKSPKTNDENYIVLPFQDGNLLKNYYESDISIILTSLASATLIHQSMSNSQLPYVSNTDVLEGGGMNISEGKLN
jgi:hypothetical protein